MIESLPMYLIDMGAELTWSRYDIPEKMKGREARGKAGAEEGLDETASL